MSRNNYGLDTGRLGSEHAAVTGIKNIGFSMIGGLRDAFAAGEISLIAVCRFGARDLAFLLRTVVPVLADGERSRLEGLRNHGARAGFLASRLLVKAVCGALEGTPARSVETTHGLDGRFILAGTSLRYHAGISHTRDAAAFLLSAVAPVGVDIERLRRPPIAVARKYFSTGELAAVEGAGDRSAAFFRLWTLKESLAKMEGEGIIGVLRNYEFAMDGGSVLCRNMMTGGPPPARFESMVLGRHALGAAFGGAAKAARTALVGPVDCRELPERLKPV